MKVAIVALTVGGAVQGRLLQGHWEGTADLFLKEGRGNQPGEKTFASLKTLLADIYGNYDGIVFIMAVGIVVRMLGPHLQNKHLDPAVVVVDEQGRYAISVLSGHVGGANDLAITVAGVTGGQAIITTATDVQGKVAPDLVASRLQLAIEPKEKLVICNAMLANGGELTYWVDETIPWAERIQKHLLKMGAAVRTGLPNETERGWQVVVTPQRVPERERAIYLRPRMLIAGIGCRRGTSADEIIAALTISCGKLNYSLGTLAALASIDIKSDEIGLCEAAKKLRLPLRFCSSTELQEIVHEQRLETSEFVKTTIGVGNVCEAAALKQIRGNKALLVPRQVVGRVTVALALVDWP